MSKLDVYGGLAVLAVFPLTGQYVIQAILSLFAWFFILSPYIVGVWAVYTIVRVLRWGFRDKLNVPSKRAKTERQKYIPTGIL